MLRTRYRPKRIDDSGTPAAYAVIVSLNGDAVRGGGGMGRSPSASDGFAAAFAQEMNCPLDLMKGSMENWALPVSSLPCVSNNPSRVSPLTPTTVQYDCLFEKKRG